MEAITGAITTAVTVAGECITFLTSQPLCLLLIGLGLIPVGLGIFKSAKRAAR